MDTEDLAAMSGQSNFRRPPTLDLNDVLLEGARGYFRKRIKVGQTERDQKPEEIDLGTNVQVVFLKVRRRLVERGERGVIVRSTNEHNTKKDIVRLTHKGDGIANTQEEGSAEALREKYPQLRTVQVVYALLYTADAEPELVRIHLKGSSLGSEAKPKGVMDFYDYIQSFGDENMFEYRTKLGVITEDGRMQYYAISFERGEKLQPEDMHRVATNLRMVHDVTTKQDAYYKATAAPAGSVIARSADEAEQGAELPPPMDYPGDDINPDDIPF